MVSSLGGTGYQGLVIPVISVEASNTIKRGHVCAIAISASNPAATFLSTVTQNKDYGAGTVLQTDIPFLQVSRGAVDTATIGNYFNVGIAKADILPGKTGEIIVLGMAKVIANAAITVGEVISSAAAGEVLDAANASHANPFGFMLEAVSAADATADTPRWAYVNFAGPAFGNGNNGAAYAQATKFHGKGY